MIYPETSLYQFNIINHNIHCAFVDHHNFATRMITKHQVSQYNVTISWNITVLGTSVGNYNLYCLKFCAFPVNLLEVSELNWREATFLEWNLSFKFWQIHTFNFPIAFFNTLVSVKRILSLSYHDLWFFLMRLTW